MRKLYAVIDTEGKGGVYNVGIVIINHEGDTIAEWSGWADLAMIDAYSRRLDRAERFTVDMVENNLRRWRRADPATRFNTSEELAKAAFEWVTRFTIGGGVYAYNSSFDCRILRNSYSGWNCLNFFDIYQPFKTYLKTLKGYSKAAQLNKWFTTDKEGSLTQNISYKAQNAAAFILGDPLLTEDHEALSDARLEAVLLWRLLSLRKKTRHLPPSGGKK